MKIIYVCEVCHAHHFSAADAMACETQVTESYQVGTIFGNASRDSFYKGITFVVAENCVERHLNYLCLWAFRDNGAGDSRHPKDLCGGQHNRLHKSDKPDVNHPTFKRALAFLKKHNIPAYVWDGENSIPYEDYRS